MGEREYETTKFRFETPDSIVCMNSLGITQVYMKYNIKKIEFDEKESESNKNDLNMKR